MKLSKTITIILLIGLLTGCSQTNNIATDLLGKQLLRKSGINEDPGYQVYQRYKESNMLDQEGYFLETENTVRSMETAIQVSFGMNGNLYIEYFWDKEGTKMLDTIDCMVDPGTTIYADVRLSKNVPSSMYRFSGFRLYSFDEGERTLLKELPAADEGTLTQIEIPSLETRDLFIEPVGEFEERVITLQDYCIDDEGNKKELSGSWNINGNVTNEETATISPTNSYIISYQYDNNEYFYVSSSPECYYSSNQTGEVIFNQREAIDETEEYSVELHKYLSLQLTSDTSRKVKVNDGNEQNISTNGEIDLPPLKYGDSVILETNKAWESLENSRELILTSTEKLADNKYRYILTVPQPGGEFLFIPSDYSYEHGTISFKCFGEYVTSPQLLAQGSVIKYEADTIDEGYWLPDEEHSIIVGDEEETIKQLKSIHFEEKMVAKVTLPQPNYGGSIQYSIDNKTIEENICEAYTGNEIKMIFKPWAGWMLSSNDVKNNITYLVNAEPEQTVLIPGIDDINKLFSEDNDHKPLLSVILEKTIAKDMTFTITAANVDVSVKSSNGKWQISGLGDLRRVTDMILDGGEAIIKNQKIGTQSPIDIKIGHKAIKPETALRITTLKTHNDKKETKETDIRYITDLSNTIDPIYIYEPSGSNAKVYYKAIDISIGIVDVNEYKDPKPAEHTSIQLTNTTTGKILKSGDLVEDSQKVTVSIKPVKGYYISGKNVNIDAYRSTMKYSDYTKDISDIIKDHPAIKYYSMALDTSDTYAKYSYKLDGKQVTGDRVEAKGGQKLTLIYEITDSNYKLAKGAGGVLGIGSSDVKYSGDIKIDSSLDGTLITKETFGIVVEKRK